MRVGAVAGLVGNVVLFFFDPFSLRVCLLHVNRLERPFISGCESYFPASSIGDMFTPVPKADASGFRDISQSSHPERDP